MQQQNTAVARLVYEKAKSLCSQAGLDPETAKLTQSFLRLENPLVGNKTNFVFPFLTNQNNASGSIYNTEQRLNQQDSFFASSIGFFITANASAVDASAPLRTYPNPLNFPVGLTALETLYNSTLTFAANNDLLLPAWDLSRHRFVPQTQHVAAAPAAMDQLDLGGDGFFPLEPNLVFIGSKNNVLTLNLPAALATFDANSRVVVIFRGVLAQNSTSVN